MKHGFIEKIDDGVFFNVVNVESWEENEKLTEQAVYDVGYYNSGKAVYFFWSKEDVKIFAKNNDILILPTQEEFELVFSICRDYNNK